MLKIIYQVSLVTFVVYFVTLILSRMLGRKLVSQMTFFDYIVGIMIGTAAMNATTSAENPSLSGFITLIVISFLTLTIDLIHLKSIKLRKLVDSEPVIVIEKGKIIDMNMRRIRLTMDELTMLLREKNYFNISEVENAILEPNGQLTVQLKADKQPITPSDMNISVPYKGLTRDLIIDGVVLENNLKYINLNIDWLKKSLLSYGIQDISCVFYAGLDTSGNLYVSKRQTDLEVPGKHGIE